MTVRSTVICVSAAFGLALSSLPSAGEMVYTAGDLVLGFQASSGDGSGSTYVFNAGPGVAFRDGTASGVIANLNADLSATFGINWFSRPDVFWGLAGVRDPSGAGANTVVAGDPRATIYISRAASSPGASEVWILPADSGNPARSSTVISAANSIAQMQSGYRFLNGLDVPRTPTPSSSGRGTVQSTGDINNWSIFNPFSGSAFGGVLVGGVQGAFSVNAPPAYYLDLYRLIGRSSAQATPNDPVGQGRLIGTLSINATGEVRFQVSAPPSDPYAAWATSFGLTGTEAEFAGDPDGDGLENGVEFVIGGNPKQATDADKAPTLTREADAVVFVFRRVDAAAELNPGAQFTTNQFGAWTPAVDGTAGVTVTSENDGFGAGVDRVTVRLPWTPAAGASIFVRLAVNPKP